MMIDMAERIVWSAPLRRIPQDLRSQQRKRQKQLASTALVPGSILRSESGERHFTIRQMTHLSGLSPQTLDHRMSSGGLHPVLLPGDETLYIAESEYRRALAAGVLDYTVPWGRRGPDRVPVVCARVVCKLPFTVPQGSRASYCSNECLRQDQGVASSMRLQDAATYIAQRRGLAKPYSRERIRQFLAEGRLSMPLTKESIDAALAAGWLDPRPNLGRRPRAQDEHR